MKNFFKMMFASMVGLLLFSIIWIVIVFTIIGGLMAGMASDAAIQPISKPSILEIRIDNVVPDRAYFDPIDRISGTNRGKAIGLNTLLRSLKQAKTDNNIKGIVIAPGLSASISPAQVQEIRKSLESFKESGKFVYSYAEVYDQNTYWLASVSDTIAIQPQGSILLRGVHMEVMFLKNMLDKFGVEMQVVRHGKFKSAVEPYMQTAMSEANKAQYTALANAIWSNICKDIAKGRNLSEEAVNESTSKVSGYFIEDAKKEGLVDIVAPLHEFERILMAQMGVEKEKDLEVVSIENYATTIVDKVKTTDKIAVVYANGEIGVGKGSDKEIGMENIIKALKDATENENVKAIVLRVNSPGGSVLTSDMIYQQVLETKKKKPIIASYGSYAASGGYYISCATNYIFAQPTTLTGSIGVFGVIPNVKKITEKVGLSFDEVNTHDNSGFMSIRRPMTQGERALQQRNIETIYSDFISKVGAGRNLSVAQVDSIGQGRVWSGQDALKIGLVDEMGGIEDAIAYAAKLVKLEQYKIEAFPKTKSTYQLIMESVSDIRMNTTLKTMEEYLGTDAAELLKMASYVKESNKGVVYARMPYGIVIE